MEIKIEKLIDAILKQRKEIPFERCLLVGISGIDASGKGFITTKLAEKIRRKGFNVANINVDGWLNLPSNRFNPEHPAENFHENSMRFDEMFEKLIFPLKENRSVKLTADFAEETATEFFQHEYVFQNIDIILLEGIFLFKKAFKDFFDLKIWIECSFETALKRAIARSQEGLSVAETINAYQTIYFPAQEIYFAKDSPKDSSDLIFDNN